MAFSGVLFTKRNRPAPRIFFCRKLKISNSHEKEEELNLNTDSQFLISLLRLFQSLTALKANRCFTARLVLTVGKWKSLSLLMLLF